jgi:hypothetical protein
LINLEVYVLGLEIAGEDWRNWPSVEYPNIYNYLIQTLSTYTGESLKAYMNGWLGEVEVIRITTLAEPHFTVL